MGGIDRFSNLPAHVRGNKAYLKPSTAADATFLASSIIDRAEYGEYPDSLLIMVPVAFTSASGATGATNTLAIQVYDDTASAMGTEATYGSAYSYVYTWVADGANGGIHVYQVDITNANRYVRVKAKLTESGTITVSAQSLAIAVACCGLKEVPSDAYVAAGYQTTSEPTA